MSKIAEIILDWRNRGLTVKGEGIPALSSRRQGSYSTSQQCRIWHRFKRACSVYVGFARRRGRCWLREHSSDTGRDGSIWTHGGEVGMATCGRLNRPLLLCGEGKKGRQESRLHLLWRPDRGNWLGLLCPRNRLRRTVDFAHGGDITGIL